VAGEIKTTEELFGISDNSDLSSTDNTDSIDQQVQKEFAVASKQNIPVDDAKSYLATKDVVDNYLESFSISDINPFPVSLGNWDTSKMQPSTMSLGETAAETGKAALRMPQRLLAMAGGVGQYISEYDPAKSWNPSARLSGKIRDYIVSKLPDKERKAYTENDQKWRQSVSDYSKRWRNYFNRAAETGFEAPSEKYKDATWLQDPLARALVGATENSGPFAAALAVSYLSKSPTAGLTLMGVLSGGESYAQMTEQGADRAVAQNLSAIIGVWESTTELMPFDEIFNKPMKSILSKFIRAGTIEGFQEVVQGFGENFLTHFGLNYDTKEDWNNIPIAVQKGFEHLMDGFLDNLSAGFLLGGPAGVFVGGAQRAKLSKDIEQRRNKIDQRLSDIETELTKEAVGSSTTPIPTSTAAKTGGKTENAAARDNIAPETTAAATDIEAVKRWERYNEILDKGQDLYNTKNPVWEKSRDKIILDNVIAGNKKVGYPDSDLFSDIFKQEAKDAGLVIYDKGKWSKYPLVAKNASDIKKYLEAKDGMPDEYELLGITQTLAATDIEGQEANQTQQEDFSELTQRKTFLERILPNAQEIFENPRDKTEIQTVSENVATELAKQKTLSKEEFRKVEAEKSKELSRRVGRMAGTIESMKKQGASSSDLQRAVGVMRGSLYVKQRWPSIRQQLGDAVEKMHSYIWNLPQWRLRILEKHTTAMSLDKLLDGYYLTKDEITHISDVFPQLGQVALARRPASTRAMDSILSIVGLPKATLASGDISAMGRQLLLLWGAYPELMPTAQWESMKIAGRWKSEDYAKALEQAMDEDPFFHFAKDYIAVTKPGNRAVGREQMEEKFPTRFISKIPGVSRSEAAFADVSTMMRVAALESQVRHAENLGNKLSETDLKKIGHTIDVLSGRMDLPKFLEPLSAALSTVFFSPRTLGARAIAPFKLASLNSQSRMMALRAFTTIGAGVTALLLLAKLAHRYNKDIDAELNPLSGNGLKIRIKNTYVDITGGYANIIRTIARLATGMTKNQAGRIREMPRKDIVVGFLKTKQSPALSFASKLWTGEDFQGNQAFQPPQGTVGEWMTELGISKTTQMVSKEMYEMFMFLPVQDVISAGQTDGWLNGLIAGPLAVEGIGLVSYPETASTSYQRRQDELAITAFGQPWEKISISQKKQLTEEVPALAEMEVAVQKEKLKKSAGGNEYPSKAQLKTQDSMYDRVPDIIQTELNNLGIRNIGSVGRSISGSYLNDVEYKQYTELTTDYIINDLDEILISDNYTSLASQAEKREMLLKTIKSSKARALKEMKEEWNVSD
jgi:hypothetical protein